MSPGIACTLSSGCRVRDLDTMQLAAPSYEPEYGQSGLGELIGQSIIEHGPESVELRIDFPLTRAPGRAVSRATPLEPAAVNATRRPMSLRAVMHYLFERAGTAKFSKNGHGISL